MSAFDNATEYELGKVLSRDKVSHTYLASIKDRDGDQHFRVRRIFSAAADRKKADRSSAIVENLSALSHKGLLSVVDSFVMSNEDSGDRDLCIVYEQVSGCTLAQKLAENSFDPEITLKMSALELPDVMDLFFNTLVALEYLHNNNTVHMDLRPDSVILPDKAAGGSVCVLTNYGLADIVDAVSLEFIAPEVHKREPLVLSSMCKADVWAVSYCYFVLLIAFHGCAIVCGCVCVCIV